MSFATPMIKLTSTVPVNHTGSLPLAPLWKSVAILGLIMLLFSVFFVTTISPYQSPSNHLVITNPTEEPDDLITHSSDLPTNISHIVFGFTGSINTWKHKRYYSQTWWRPNITRGYLSLDRYPTPQYLPWPPSSPPFRVYKEMSEFAESRNLNAWSRLQVRIFRKIVEVFREGDKDVRWYVFIDDDTVLFLDNLVEVLGKYDHNKFFYIGTNSERIKSNSDFDFDMGFGGAGIALSYPLVKLLDKKLDHCIETYYHLMVSDYMLYSCLYDLGITLTHHKGFHQMDILKDVWGLLSSHPQTPVLSLHHIDSINPIFPYMKRHDAINHLMKAVKADNSRLLQQTTCYQKPKNWTVSISWGYSVHIYESILSRSLLKRPLETFEPYGGATKPFFMFNTRKVTNNPCEAPHVFFMDSVERSFQGDHDIVTTYVRKWPRNLPACSETGSHGADSVSKIQVFSPSTTSIQAGEMECCDIQMVDMNTAQVKYKACMA